MESISKDVTSLEMDITRLERSLTPYHTNNVMPKAEWQPIEEELSKIKEESKVIFKNGRKQAKDQEEVNLLQDREKALQDKISGIAVTTKEIAAKLPTNIGSKQCVQVTRIEDVSNSTCQSNMEVQNKESETLCLTKDLNILLLGETGVGKSTWINGFVNFLNNETLQEAEKKDLITLIPSTFTVCDKNYTEITVSTGNDSNEVQCTGQSATQGCKIYSFPVTGITIKLIDTPGIGDTRGVEQDKKNFDNILTTLSLLPEIHGICILLKPNNARLTLMFRFCIKELLTYLHKDASQNIMFCFTNSRSTFYRPGDTLPALKKLLSENDSVNIPIDPTTIYCFDSEAYRFLAAVKNKTPPVPFTQDERENFAKSWEKSIEETLRMLLHINSLKPHATQSTLNLNHARQIVLKLSRPLAETTKNIQIKKAVIQTQLEEIMATNESIKDLEKKVKYNKSRVEITKLEYPKTVCTNSACTEVYGDDTMKQIRFSTVCHEACSLDNVTADATEDDIVKNCGAMDENDFCKNCKHYYKDHAHYYYDSNMITEQVVNHSVQEMLATNCDAAEVKKKLIEDLQKIIKEYDCELEEIQTVSAKFSCFLKTNAITPYNDALLDYIDHLIRVEQNKIPHGGSTALLESMIISKNSYEKEIKVLEAKISSNDADVILKPTEIDDVVTNLTQLKHNGKDLHKAFECVNETKQKSFMKNLMVSVKSVPRIAGEALASLFRKFKPF